MKTKSFILAMATMMTAATWNVAQAVSVHFTASNGQFVQNYSVQPGSNPTDTDKKNFIWQADPTLSGGTQFDLAVGNSYTFAYATFQTSDFKISNNDLQDYLNNTIGTFSTTVFLTPPTVGVSIPTIGGDLGIPRVTGTIKAKADGNGDAINGGVWVDLDNQFYTTLFGNGGKYRLQFNDLGSSSSPLSVNGTYGLTATVTLDSAPVPEPGTMVLLGVGMLGLAIFGKRRMGNKEA